MSSRVLELLCAVLVMGLLFLSFFGGFNFNSLLIVVMGIAVLAVLQDLRSLRQGKPRKPHHGTTDCPSA